jgi:hypothetical protein
MHGPVGHSKRLQSSVSDTLAPVDVIARFDRAIQSSRSCLLDRLTEPGDDSEVAVKLSEKRSG